MLAFVFPPKPDRHPDAACAVVGCTERGLPQICPYDGQYHGHGRIHYNCHTDKNWGWPVTTLEFRPMSEDWFFVCDTHYQQIGREITEARIKRRQKMKTPRVQIGKVFYTRVSGKVRQVVVTGQRGNRGRCYQVATFLPGLAGVPAAPLPQLRAASALHDEPGPW